MFRHLLEQAQDIVCSRWDDLPSWHALRLREVLGVALALTDDLSSMTSPAFFGSLPDSPSEAEPD